MKKKKKKKKKNSHFILFPFPTLSGVLFESQSPFGLGIDCTIQFIPFIEFKAV